MQHQIYDAISQQNQAWKMKTPGTYDNQITGLLRESNCSTKLSMAGKEEGSQERRGGGQGSVHFSLNN